MKRQNGITLIALVITIIVLLILAGVSISMVVGNNGILNQASTAKLRTEEAEEAQEEALENLKIEMDNFILGEKKPEGNTPVTSVPADFFDFDATTGTILGINEEYLGEAISTYDYYGDTKLLNYYKMTDPYSSSNYFDNYRGWCVLKEDIDTLIVPAEINGKPVYTVKNIGALNVRKIIYSEGITSISDYKLFGTGLSSAGYGNDPDVANLKLEEVVIPSTITNIDQSFTGCSTLQKVYFKHTTSTYIDYNMAFERRNGTKPTAYYTSEEVYKFSSYYIADSGNYTWDD